ncbi:hypothetical protein DYH09_20220 [bacterium CPR1]|nr:hypothetical protein [bacterium CPR1]
MSMDNREDPCPGLQALQSRMKALPSPRPPAALRAGLAERVRRERLKMVVRSGLAAACLMVLLGLLAWARFDEEALFVGDHRHMVATGLADIRTQNPDELERFFSSRLQFAPSLPDWAWAQPTSGRLCRIRSRVMARIQYRYGPHDLSLFVRPARSLAPEQLRERHLQGYQLLSWTRAGLEYLLVAPEEAGSLRPLLGKEAQPGN